MSSAGARLRAAFGELARGLADLLLPESCGSCRGSDIASGGLCDGCNVRLLALVSLPYCPRCGATVGPNIPVRQDGCGMCPNPLPKFTRVIRIGPYAEPIRSAIKQLKYHKQELLLRQLGEMLSEAVAACCTDEKFDLIVPVPMHWRRRMFRGYDHADVIARSIANNLGAPVGPELIRVRPTPPQVNLPRTRRIENVRGAFSLASRSVVSGAKILLVDDVTTTGATANEAARTLLSGGASGVSLAVVAKAEPPRAYTQHWTEK